MDWKTIECMEVGGISTSYGSSYINIELGDVDPRIIQEFSDTEILQNLNSLEDFLDEVDIDDLILYLEKHGYNIERN